MVLVRIQEGTLRALQEQVAQARTQVDLLLNAELERLGAYAVDLLSADAPRGKSGSGGSPIGTDAPGALANSFRWERAENQVDVLCSQPNKLDIIVNGRGPVYPRNKKALFWEGLDHPVKFARATTPNDFVTPAIEAVIYEVGASADAAAAHIAVLVGGA
jgi:hypothetical protein